ncbi:MAG: hypothetical protein WBD31_10870 [Rubripirellula sp.]
MSGWSNEAVRRRWFVAIAILILGVYSVFGLLDARSAADRLAQARGDLDEVKTKISQIDRLKDGPRVAALELQSPAEISNRIEAARQSAGLNQAALLREQPTDPQRIGRSDFEMRMTTIGLAPSTMVQILKFCDALRDEKSGTMVRDLRLSVPRNQGDSGAVEKWDAEMTLTQMIFSPKSK